MGVWALALVALGAVALASSARASSSALLQSRHALQAESWPALRRDNAELVQSLGSEQRDLALAEHSSQQLMLPQAQAQLLRLQQAAAQQAETEHSDQLWGWGHHKKKKKHNKYKRAGPRDENNDLLPIGHPYTPVYAPNVDDAALSEAQREAALWGQWNQGYSTYWGRPRNIGYGAVASARQALLRQQQERALAGASAKPSALRFARGTQQLTRMNKIYEPAADLNPYWSPGWNYDEYSNFNPPVGGEPQLVTAGDLNKKVGFKTWTGRTNSYSPPITEGRYGDGNAMDATEMNALF